LVVEDSVLVVEVAAMMVVTVTVVAVTVVADAGAIAQQTAPRIPNTIQAQRPTAGLVVMTASKSMIAIPVATNYKDTKTQQPQLIQRQAP
jgi:hypothetical protein